MARTKLGDLARSLMGITEFQEVAPVAGSRIDSPEVDSARKGLGGQIQMLPISQTRWLMADLEQAQQIADNGDMIQIGRLSRSMKRDGVISGLMDTRTSGLVALPKRFRGDDAMIEALQAETASRSVFDEMMPPAELAAFASDLIKLGVAVGILEPVPGRSYPVFIRLEPEFLKWRQNEGRWYYQSIAGPLPVEPGRGRWVLMTSGRQNPWQNGIWHALGRAFITKEHSILGRANFSRALANPARVAQTVKGATDVERADMVQKLLAWGYNTTIALPEGWEAKILETMGRGWEVFAQEIEAANNEVMIALCGQIVTTTGGSGFANADIHRTIRADLIKKTGDELAYAINTQILPAWAINSLKATNLDKLVRVEYDTAPPQDRQVEAEALGKVASAIVSVDAVATKLGYELDAEEFFRRFGVPIKGKKKAEGAEITLSTPDVKVEPPKPDPVSPDATQLRQPNEAEDV